VLSEEDNAAINKSMEAHRSVCAEIGKLEMQIGQIATAGVREQANVERLRQQRSLLASGRCPTCEQATDKVLSGLDSRMAEAETICDLTKRQADEERTALQEQLQEVRDLAAEFARRTAAARATAVVNAEATVQRIRDANALAVREHTLAVRAWDTCCHEIAEAHKGMVTAWEAECLHIMRGHEENLRAVEARNAERREAARRERDGWLKSAEDRYEAWKREHAAWLDAENTRTDGHHREMAAWRTACERNRTTFDEANARYNSAVLSWTGACRDREANLKLRAQLDTRLTQARTQAAALGEKLGESISALDETKARAAVLEACERVLGLRGVRATVLGKALVGINAASNAWLSRIPFGDGRRLRIILSATTERKDGGESDAISLLIQKDADEAREYLSCSGGERRRVDIALLLGLADVAAAASGSTPGTLFCDELYDALDQTGIDAVCSLLDTLAKDRAVVVITHDQNLIDHIRPARHFRFDSGGNVSVAA